jgi:hypothetical protein
VADYFVAVCVAVICGWVFWKKRQENQNNQKDGKDQKTAITRGPAKDSLPVESIGDAEFVVDD